MAKHFITMAAINAAESLSEARAVWEQKPKGEFDMNGVNELVGIINKASVSLRQICTTIRHERKRNDL